MNPYAPPAAAYRCKRPLLSACFNFALLATLLSCAAGICVAYATNSPLLTAACCLASLSVQCCLTAAACWLADRLSVNNTTTEEAP
ncbi:MAG: hypothetical protein WAW39_17170 [Prosthecobacter sp.]|uniref:hypothetical protein n=1 Tax=Prosthecobacter sp. TaxID=1965333 RepID=UPI003BB21552